jgi:hypothetical protein
MANSKGYFDGVLFDLYVCFDRKLPVPSRVATAFVELYQKGLNGELESWDEVFGKPMPPRVLEKALRRISQGDLVAEAVEKLKAEGRSLNEEAFEKIAEDTAVGGKTKAKELLREHRYWAKKWNRFVELGRNIPKNFRR